MSELGKEMSARIRKDLAERPDKAQRATELRRRILGQPEPEAAPDDDDGQGADGPAGKAY